MNTDRFDDEFDPDEAALAAELAAGGPPARETLLEHSGYVVVVGKPNVGKSTLMNGILGEKIAIVSHQPQTTRIRQLGIYSAAGVQAVFVDTPGIHQPRHRLGAFMVRVAEQALSDADVILFVVDLSTPPEEADQRVATLARRAAESGVPVVLALNKLDRIQAADVLPRTEAYRALVPAAEWIALIARQGRGVDEVLKAVTAHLPSGPQYFPDDQISDLSTRDIVAEMVREKALLNLQQEVPHAIAVEIEEFKARSETLTYVRAVIYVERDGQKAILIGKNGGMLKKISTAARSEIEAFLNTQVFLECWVKVLPNWRQDEALLYRLGYRLSQK